MAHWTFDEGAGSIARDASTGGHDATLVGAAWTSGTLGGAVSFDGVDDHVDAAAFDVAGTGGVSGAGGDAFDLAAVGLALWTAGFAIEVVSDRQKRLFRQDPANAFND